MQGMENMKNEGFGGQSKAQFFLAKHLRPSRCARHRTSSASVLHLHHKLGIMIVHYNDNDVRQQKRSDSPPTRRYDRQEVHDHGERFLSPAGPSRRFLLFFFRFCHVQ
jgi:hypothetical protein